VNEHLQQAIRTIEQEIEALDQHRSELVRAVDVLRPLAAMSSRVSTNGKSSQNGTERSKARINGTALEGLPDAGVGVQENGRRLKVLEALKASPLATRELADIIRVDRKLTKMTLQRMAKVGLVIGVGTGPARRWTLPGKSAKEAP